VKTSSVTEGRRRLVGVLSRDYALQEYGVTEEQLERAEEFVRREVRKARRAGKLIHFKVKPLF
jgi:hypothetical protein